MLVFEEKGELEYPRKKLSKQGREPTTNSATYDAESGNQPGQHWWEISQHCAIPAPKCMREDDLCDTEEWLYFLIKP